MGSYNNFAFYYDSLTQNVDYAGRADYIVDIINNHDHDAGIVLDLACGTGSLTLELYRRGYDIYGIDGSTAMLSVASEKAYDNNAEILFLCQDMEKLNLYGTINTCICALDSINHLPSLESIQRVFNNVAFFMEKDGLFIFDFNTPYKHSNVLANNVFIYDKPDVFCIWQNHLNSKNLRVNINLDFFAKQDNYYIRESEVFSEITVNNETIVKMLEKAGFVDIEFYEDLSYRIPDDKTEKITFCAKRGNSNLNGQIS